MDPVDVLSFAVTAAQQIRSSADPDAVLIGGYRAVGLDPPADAADPTAVRIARLVDAAGDRRRELMDYLQARSGPLPLNRTVPAEGPRAEPDPEAERLAEYVEEAEDDGREMFGVDFPAFQVAARRVDSYFGGRTVVERDGQTLTEDEAGDMQPGDGISHENEGLPVSVRCLIDYPLDVPVLFTIETGGEPWSVWDICCAIADQYAKVYESPGRYGVWGHDLSDLVIEELVYYPEERLIYPHIGS